VHAAVVDNLKSQGRSRLASMPVRRQFNVTDEALARQLVTPPPPPPPLKQVISEQLNSFHLCTLQLASKCSRCFRSLEV
jgi:hypothetical protein